MTRQELDAKMLRLQRGDERAFEEIYKDTGRGLFAYIRSLCRDYHIAEDMMQITYIRLRTSIASYRAGGNPYAWLYAIARNATLNEMKKRQRELSLDPDENVSQFGSYRLDEEGSPVTEAMDKVLNETERQIVALHVISGFKHREIAEILEKPLGTVIWTYNNAPAKMRRALQDG